MINIELTYGNLVDEIEVVEVIRKLLRSKDIAASIEIDKPSSKCNCCDDGCSSN